MTDESLIEKAKQVIEEMQAYLAKLEAEMAQKQARKWPEKIEAGMVFKSKKTEAVWMAKYGEEKFVCIGNAGKGGHGVCGSELYQDSFTYLGHARDVLSIRTEAHEPTGAELVEKVCEFSDSGFETFASSPKKCHGYDEHLGFKDHHGEWWNFGRLAR